MIFTKLVIDNFGVYAGTNAFYLRPESDEEVHRPIILFGGKNGSGKTTILDAIRLCLYGRSALGNRVRQKDYELYIGQRIHRNSSQQIQNARIRLIFEHTHVGVTSTYDAVRSWDISGKSFKEEVSIFKDGLVLQDISPEHWDDFLRDLIPPGVADLFFFDGEQIQALANDSTQAEALSDAVRGLLNLDLVERLSTDLNVFLRQQKQKGVTNLEVAARQAVEDFEKTEASILELRKERAHFMSLLDRANNKIEQARQSLLTEGAGFIEQRDAMFQRRSYIEQSIENVNSSIRELAAGLLPFAIAPQWSAKLRSRLVSEEKAQQSQLSQSAIETAAERMKEHLLSKDFLQKYQSLSVEEWQDVAGEIANFLSNGREHTDVNLRHPVSDQTRYLLYSWIDETAHDIPEQLAELSSKLEALERERAEIELALERIPDELVATPLLDEFQNWSLERGSLEERIDAIDVEIHKLKLQLAEDERKVRQTRQSLADAEGLDIRVQRAAKAQVILDEYLDRITKIKIEELENTFVEFFNRLARKKGMVQAVEISHQDFTTTLYGANKTHIPKSDLSAGEKQLYAVALLWALRAVSGRILPIIMDTPMGRLDTDHRSALLDHFFPFASHQVILLSTDSEIDMDAYKQLAESVTRTYRLEYDEAAGYTYVTEGYFGQPQMESEQ